LHRKSSLPSHTAVAAPAHSTIDWTVTAATGAGGRREPEWPPQFAVDLLKRENSQ
jgi:hypothetical protein